MTGNATPAERVPVLIVGGGGAGLSLAVLLLQQGIRPLLVERRPDISVYPRARNMNFRTLEVFRNLDLEPAVRAAGAPLSQVIVKPTLASQQEQLVDPLADLVFSPSLSPEPFAWHCPQSRFEPILRAAARERGGDIRYDTELASFTPDDDGVTATLVDRASGSSSSVRADYLAACDGAHSHIRQALRITTEGVGVLPEYAIFVYFRAPWQPLIRGRDSDAFVIQHADAEGIFLVAKGDLGMFLITYRPSETETADSFTTERCRSLVEKAIGDPAIPVEIVDIVHWQPAEDVASQFQAGRVLLVGDSAHTMPAYKGLGMNTAVQSAQNLAWKLGAVLDQRAGTDLLRSYHAERHPVGRFAARQSLTGPAAQWLAEGTKAVDLPAAPDLPFFFPIVGYRYRSDAVISEVADSAPPDQIALLDKQELTGQPGTRVPHIWVESNGQRMSTLDLVEGHFVLLTGTDGGGWCAASAALAASLGIRLSAFRIGSTAAELIDLEGDWEARLGITSSGALLIRPDSFVAWRSRTSCPAPEDALGDVLKRILCRA